MYVAPEIIVIFFIVSFLIYTMPLILVKFSKTLKGRFLLLVLTIVITLYNKTGGLLIALFFIFLSEFSYEVYNDVIFEGFDNNNNNNNNNTNDKTKKFDLISLQTILSPKNSSSQKVVNIKK